MAVAGAAALACPSVFKHGWLTKEGSFIKNWKRRYFYLWTDGKLKYFAQAAASQLGEIDLLNATVAYTGPPKVTGKSFALEIVTPGRTLLVCAENANDCKAYVSRCYHFGCGSKTARSELTGGFVRVLL